MTFQPSPQQAALFNWVKNDKGNAFVQAVAGAGKTTSLIEAIAFMKGNVALVAFNKKIADEAKERCAAKGLQNVFAGTFHSFGFSSWKFFTKNKFIKVEAYKVQNILEDMQISDGYYAFCRSLVSLAKQAAIGHFGKIEDRNLWKALVNHHDLDADLDKDHPADLGVEHAIAALKKSNELGRQMVDFDDMIYLPVLHDIKMFQNAWVLVDEAQDTNPARRALAKKMVSPSGRMIFVGDRHQAIYGFTGADAASVDIICQEFKCSELPLTVTYRCPKTVVKASQAYVSHIQAHESAPEGKVETVTMDAFTDLHATLKAEDAILCRKTAPLVSLAYTLIRKNIACHVEGRDIGAGLLNMISKWKRIKTVEKFLEKLSDWEAAQVKKAQEKKKDLLVESIRDKCETMRVICEGCHMIEEVKAKINNLFSDSSGCDKPKNLTLSTVHKAKGREWNSVYVLGFNEYMPSKMAKLPWQREQETNLIYVAFTRAKNALTLVG